jgi:hypothetical protein
MGLDREEILEALRGALEPEPRVLAMWEGGSAAWGRVDEWSDLDLQLLVEDDWVEPAFELVERALAALSRIELRWPVPMPTFHGHRQCFYRLEAAGPFLVIDLAVLKLSAPLRFLEPEQHGWARVLFDKGGHLTPPPFSTEEHRKKMRADLQSLRGQVDLLSAFVDKELLRGQRLDALNFYMNLVLRPLVAVLGMRHRPLRYSFGPRYLHRDLPEALARELEDLYFVADASELPAKLDRARTLFHRALAELDLEALPLEALSAEARRASGPGGTGPGRAARPT